jgi:hypothetical protein
MKAVAAVEAATIVDDCRKLRRESVFFMAGAIIEVRDPASQQGSESAS